MNHVLLILGGWCAVDVALVGVVSIVGVRSAGRQRRGDRYPALRPVALDETSASASERTLRVHSGR